MNDGVRQTYVVDWVVVDGRELVRVREVLPAPGKKGVHDADPLRQRRRLRVPVVVALVVAVLAVVAIGWTVYTVLAFLLGHAWEIGALTAVLMLLAGGGGGCTVVVHHIRR